MPQLENGDAWPRLAINVVDGSSLALPAALAGAYGIVLIYRGAWCRFCVAQLSVFHAERDALDRLGVKVVALSVDDAAASGSLVEKLGLGFPVGHGADAEAIAARTGAFTNDSPRYLEPAAFFLQPDGSVLAAVDARNAVGWPTAAEAVGFVGFMPSMQAAHATA